MTLLSDTLSSVLKEGTSRLKEANVKNALYEAREMLYSAFSVDRITLILYPDTAVDADRTAVFFDMISRRISGIPLQYVLGEWSFYGRRFFVGEGVLIPRPETEQLADICIEVIKEHSLKTVYDLCSGTGCIGITIAIECPDTDVYLFELYDDALFYLKKNVEQYNLKNVHIIKYNVMSPPPTDIPTPDLIVSNPPYIPRNEMDTLQAEVKLEPATALDGGTDGLDFYRAERELWLPVLNPYGFYIVECGEEQPPEISEMLEKYGNPATMEDMYETERFVCVRKDRLK